MKRTSIADVCRLELPRIEDPRGNLTFVEAPLHLPFAIERVFWIYDVPGGETRGAHADRHAEQFIVALSGSFRIVVDDGSGKAEFLLNRSYWGLYLPPRIWRFMDDFSTNAVALVLSSTAYDPESYVRDFDEFSALKRSEQS